jgi:hypothetical protein
MNFDPFWSSDSAENLAHPQPVRELLLALRSEDTKTYDLLFYAAFANKMLGVMKREGKDAQGFERMQQSFSEAVQHVRTILADSAAKGFARATVYTEMTANGLQMLLALIADLAIVKEWIVREQQLPRDVGTV